MKRLSAWVHGWRKDLDGWWVRALKVGDPKLRNRPDLGFTEESCIAVRTLQIAWDIDWHGSLILDGGWEK